jgi:hypothetical protein
MTEDGCELPVIDITNPAFSDDDKQQILAAFFRRLADVERDPERLRRFLSQRSSAPSAVGSATFASGLSTYVVKLEGLGPKPADREDTRPAFPSDPDGTQATGTESSDAVVKNAGPLVLRKRLRDMAGQIAAELTLLLAESPTASVHMLNIGGGPAMDSINALILVNKQDAKVLHGRRIRITVLDLDSVGPSFGSRALAVLRTPGGPLDGLEVTLDRVEYDWTDTSRLRAVTSRIGADEIAIGSSEGALFAYGSDEVVVENLKTLRASTPPGFVVVGSIINRGGPLIRTAKEMTKMAMRAFSLESFSALVGSAGWFISDAKQDWSYHQVLSLKKSERGPLPQEK